MQYKSYDVVILFNEIKNKISSKLYKFILQLIVLIKELESINIENEDLHVINLGYKSNDNLAIFDIIIFIEINHLSNMCEKIDKKI